MIDPVSVKRLAQLHPKLRDEALQILGDISCALEGRAMFRITSVLRTMSEQQKLYNQGRTTPGPIVTNAKPGSSYHNYGLALDFALIIDGKEVSWNMNKDYDFDGKADWMEVVDIFKKYGWAWGGDFKKLKDGPHFEKTFGYKWPKLLEIHNQGKTDKEGFVIIP